MSSVCAKGQKGPSFGRRACVRVGFGQGVTFRLVLCISSETWKMATRFGSVVAWTLLGAKALGWTGSAMARHRRDRRATERGFVA